MDFHRFTKPLSSISRRDVPNQQTSLCFGWSVWSYAVSPFFFLLRWKEQRSKPNPERKFYNDMKMFARYWHAFFSLHLSKRSTLQNSPGNQNTKEQPNRLLTVESNTYMSSWGWRRSTMFMGGSEGRRQKNGLMSGWQESCIFSEEKRAQKYLNPFLKGGHSSKCSLQWNTNGDIV